MVLFSFRLNLLSTVTGKEKSAEAVEVKDTVKTVCQKVLSVKFFLYQYLPIVKMKKRTATFFFVYHPSVHKLM